MRNKFKYIFSGALILLVIGFFALKVFKAKPDSHIVIILSPHYDDAVLSLGGFMAKREDPTVVATFFTAGPTEATTTPWDKNSGFKTSKEAAFLRTKENDQAIKMLDATMLNYFYQDNQYRDPKTDNLELEQELAKDIQVLLTSYNGKTVDVYGPAIFTSDITHPDHALLHQAYLDVEKNYPQKNVTFYIYEDYPYVERYTKSTLVSLEKNLEKDSNQIFDTVSYQLSSSDVKKKEKSLKKYNSQIKAFDAIAKNIVSDDIAFTKTRCGSACEVVYKIMRF